jgi:hypothetical protein
MRRVTETATALKTIRWFERASLISDWRLKMGLAQYAIVPIRDQWGVLHDGNVNGEYATKESAFESAVAAASLAIRMGHEIQVSVPGRKEGEAALTQQAK